MKKLFLMVTMAALVLSGCDKDPKDPPGPEEGDLFKITLTAGSGGKMESNVADLNKVKAGQSVSVSAIPDEGFLLSGWNMTGVGAYEETYGDGKVTRMFKMPANDAMLGANFKVKPTPEELPHIVIINQSSGGTVRIVEAENIEGHPAAVIDKDGARGVYMDATVSIEAIPGAGRTFTGWEIDSDNIELGDSSSESFEMPAADVEISATWGNMPTYNITITADTDRGSPSATPASAYEGQEITLAANPAEGWVFVEWEVTTGDIEIEDSSDPAATFIMPDEEVTIEAVYAPASPLSIISSPTEGGRVVWVSDEPADMSNVTEGTQIHIVASHNQGYIFDHWEVVCSDEGAEILNENNLTNTTLISSMPATGVSITAVFVEDPEPEPNTEL